MTLFFIRSNSHNERLEATGAVRRASASAFSLEDQEIKKDKEIKHESGKKNFIDCACVALLCRM